MVFVTVRRVSLSRRFSEAGRVVMNRGRSGLLARLGVVCGVRARLLILGLVPLALVARAAADTTGPTGPTGPTGASGPSGLAQAEQQQEQWQAWVSSPQAAAARQSSRTAYENQSPAQARSTDATTFPQIDANGIQPLEPGSGRKLVRRLGDYGALVQTGGHQAVVESPLPLFGATPSGSVAPVDLSLTTPAGQSAFMPQSSAVPVSIPAESNGSLQFPAEGFGVHFASGTGVDGTEAGGSVIYPNVGGAASDTDAIVRPLPVGADISFMLRSHASPESQILSFDLPAGWRLSDPGDGTGRIDIKAADGTLEASVLAPVATDAQGQTVPAKYTLDGSDQITLTVNHTTGDYAYPILVDPSVTVTQDYSGTSAFSDWKHVPTTVSPAPDGTGGANTAFIPQDLSSFSGWKSYSSGYSSGEYAEYLGQAPPGSTIYKLVESGVGNNALHGEEFGGIEKNTGSSCPAHASCYEPGVWQSTSPTGSGTGGAWEITGSSFSGTKYTYCVVSNCAYSATAGTTNNYAAFGLYMTGNPGGSNQAEASMDDAEMELADNVTPTVSNVTHSNYTAGKWYNGGTDTVGATGSVTTGLGMGYLTLTGAPGGTQTKDFTGGCSTSPGSSQPPPMPCPASVTYTFPTAVNYATLAEGEDPLYVQAENAVGNPSAMQPWTVNIDRTPPSLSLTGQLASDNGMQIAPGSYALNVNATDGNGTVPVSGTTQLGIKVDGMSVSGLQYTPCSGGQTQCSASTSWTFNTGTYGPGTHTIGVTATDGAGNAVTQTISVTVATPPSNTVVPTISGSAEDGQTLTASSGTWSGTTPMSYTYQWEDCDTNGTNCMNISGATTASYTIADSDVGSTIRVQVTASNAAGTAQALSAATAVVTGQYVTTYTYAPGGQLLSAANNPP
jgi:hypothetical protein